MIKFLLKYIDNKIYKFLEKNVDRMPKRLIKLVANYYTDARIRKLYWGMLGVHMGTNTFPNLGFQSTSNGEELVYIGNNVSIAPNVVLITDSCANNGSMINQISYVADKLTRKDKIVIEDEVWIGANVTILPGITIGTCSVIGAGSVVTKDVDPFCIYAGIPAKKIREFREYEYIGVIGMEFRDLKAQYNKYKTDIDSAIQKVIYNTNFIGGKEVNILEQRLAEYVGVKHCISCANGTEAMTLLMMAWDIKEGDAVFVPDFTFFSTGEIVSFRGATPVFIDVDRETFNIDIKKLENAIIRTMQEGVLTPKVIIPVDLFGLPANHYEIEKIAKKYNLLILEDAAQGFGGSINGKRACSFGNAATTSFFPAKPLGCYGDGGAIFTNDDHLARLINSLKTHGKGDNKYDNVRVGVNSRLDTIQAAILNVKLNAFAEHELEDVNRVYHLYSERLNGVVEIPVIPEGFYSSFAQYTIKLKNREQRDKLQTKLKQHGIPSMIYYIKPMHKQGAFSYLGFNEEDFAVTNELCDIVLSLPMHPYMSVDDVENVCSEIREYIHNTPNPRKPTVGFRA